MTARFRHFGRALRRPIRRPQPARLAILALAAVVLIVGAALVLQPPSGAPGPVAVGTAPEVSPPLPEVSPPPTACSFPEVSPPSTRTEAEASAMAAEACALAKHEAANSQKVAAGAPTPPPRFDFWGELYAFEATGPAYRSLTDLGMRSEAVVVGSFTGAVEPGREMRDEGAEANGMPREEASVFLANLPFKIDEVLAGSLPEQYRETVNLEYLVHPSRQEALAEVVPTAERVVLFIGSKYLRRAGIQDVYYEVGLGKGTFRDVGGTVVPLALPDDPKVGRLEGMPFDRFIDLVRRVPILDLMPEG
ncbi:MAG: hypothetical protein C0498_14070 [Anaerolinea sp.]|nr:hypothetical protein [Anaerolinea sp.]